MNASGRGAGPGTGVLLGVWALDHSSSEPERCYGHCSVRASHITLMVQMMAVVGIEARVRTACPLSTHR